MTKKNTLKKIKNISLSLAKKSYFLIALVFGLMIIHKSLDYIYPNFETGFLQDKKEIFSYYQIFLYGHILGAPIALLTGLYQFTFKRNRFHQDVGKVYVVAILFFAAPSGLGMSFYAIGGGVSIFNFLMMSLLWGVFTYLSFKAIKKGEINKHKKMMIRSFIMTNSAVLLRLFSYFNYVLNIFPKKEGYIILSLLSWLPFLIVFELINFYSKKKNELKKKPYHLV